MRLGVRVLCEILLVVCQSLRAGNGEPFEDMAKKLSKANTAAAHSSVTTTHSDSTQTSNFSSSSSVNKAGLSAPGPSSLPPVLTDEEPLPRLIVFDLDYTLWPFWVDTHVTPPIKAVAPADKSQHCSAVTDKIGDTYSFYADVPRMLYTLPMAGVRLAVASRTHAPDLARDVLKQLQIPPYAAAAAGLSTMAANGSMQAAPAATQKQLAKEKARRALDVFDAGLEIYPSSKVRHFDAIQNRTGIPYSEMIFFDDEARNKDVEQALGVLFCHVKDGMTWDELELGVRRWRRRRQN